jgi:hypothetical protein
MANVSKLILAAAITVASVTTPALAAHTAHNHHIGYVTRSNQAGVYNFAPPRHFLPPNDGGPANCCNGASQAAFEGINSASLVEPPNGDANTARSCADASRVQFKHQVMPSWSLAYSGLGPLVLDPSCPLPWFTQLGFHAVPS